MKSEDLIAASGGEGETKVSQDVLYLLSFKKGGSASNAGLCMGERKRKHSLSC